MNTYLATFHTHLSALLSCQALQGAGHTARGALPQSYFSSNADTYTVPVTSKPSLALI